MKCKHILAALACALLTLSTVGCGAFKGQTSNLTSITLTASEVNGQPPSGQNGFFTLTGNGGTIQLSAMGEYSGGTTKDLTHNVTYNVAVDPQYSQDAFGNTLLPPCSPPSCPAPAQPPYTSGTVEFSTTGLLTAIEPATCTWVDIGPVGTPAWFYVGDYVVTVTYQGITSNPIYIPVASSAGDQFYQGVENNPTGLCGPSS